jgi:hypothetical protein
MVLEVYPVALGIVSCQGGGGDRVLSGVYIYTRWTHTPMPLEYYLHLGVPDPDTRK